MRPDDRKVSRMPESFTASEVAKHNTAASLWVVIDQNVYDVTAFRSVHPGGEEILLENGGQDATFEAQLGHGTSRKAKSMMSRYFIGVLAAEPEKPVPEQPVVPAKQHNGIMSLEELAAAHDTGPADVTGGAKRQFVDLEDLGAAPAKHVVPLDDLANAAPQRNVIALDDLGTAGQGRKNVALEELGKEESSIKKAVKLENLADGSYPASRGTRTGRNPNRKASLEAARAEAARAEEAEAELEAEEKVEEEDDETKQNVRILLASWALANKQEEAPDPAKVSEREDEEGESDEDRDEHVMVPEKKKSRWERIRCDQIHHLERLTIL